MDQKVARLIDVHHQLWRELDSRQNKTYVCKQIGRKTKVITQNLAKTHSSNTKLCNRGWRITWIFYANKYFGKIIEVPGKGIEVWKLSPVTDSGIDELIYSCSS